MVGFESISPGHLSILSLIATYDDEYFLFCITLNICTLFSHTPDILFEVELSIPLSNSNAYAM